MDCQNLAVPAAMMQHVVAVESGHNPYAIGVVGGRLVRQPRTLGEAVATVRMLEEKGYNYSLGIAQVNRSNFGKYGLDSYEKAFDYCSNLIAGSRILAKCYRSAKRDWGQALSCYYSGNFVTGFRDGYVQRVFASMARSGDISATTVTSRPSRARAEDTQASSPARHTNADLGLTTHIRAVESVNDVVPSLSESVDSRTNIPSQATPTRSSGKIAGASTEERDNAFVF